MKAQPLGRRGCPRHGVGQGSWGAIASFRTYSSSYNRDGQAAATLQDIHGLWTQGQSGTVIQLGPDRQTGAMQAGSIRVSQPSITALAGRSV